VVSVHSYRHGKAVAKYLACYLRGGPIGNSRLIGCDGKTVSFRSRVTTQEVGDRDRQTVTKLSTAEFIGRFLEHVPERGMQTVRGYGLYSGNQHSRLADAFIALGHQPPTPQQDILDVALWLEGIGRDPSSHLCPVCGSRLEVIRLPRRGLWLEGIGRDPSSHLCPVCGSRLEGSPCSACPTTSIDCFDPQLPTTA
jgi:hypothetical protein